MQLARAAIRVTDLGISSLAGSTASGKRGVTSLEIQVIGASEGNRVLVEPAVISRNSWQYWLSLLHVYTLRRFSLLCFRLYIDT